MEQEYKPNLKPKKATSILDALNRLDISQLKKGATTTEKSGKSLSITGEGELVKLQLRQTGSQRGVIGSSVLSNKEMVEHTIIMGTEGLPLEPPLTGRDWQLVDTEIHSEIYTNPRKFKLSVDEERKFMPALIQGNAATRPAPFEHVVTRLARLKLLRPTQAMSEQEMGIFFSDVADLLIERSYCYTAIDQGIKALLRQDKGTFFPTIEILEKFIYPIHYKLKRRVDKLHEILSRPHRIEGNMK